MRQGSNWNFICDDWGNAIRDKEVIGTLFAGSVNLLVLIGTFVDPLLYLIF